MEQEQVTVYLKGPEHVGVCYNGKNYYGSLRCSKAFAAQLIRLGKGSYERPAPKKQAQNKEK